VHARLANFTTISDLTNKNEPHVLTILVLCWKAPPFSVFMQLRDPVDRVLSAYEFATEVASRVLWRAKNYTADPAKMNTRNVWPWSALVPFMETDMVERVGHSWIPNMCCIDT